MKGPLILAAFIALAGSAFRRTLIPMPSLAP